jgi:Ca2+-binding EF-hand superfamily protein
MRTTTTILCIGALSLGALGVALAQPGQMHRAGPAHERAGDLFDRLDTNNDGVITQEEADAAKARVQERRSERAGVMASRAIEHFDADENGALDEAELQALFTEAPRRLARHARGHAGKGNALARVQRILGPDDIVEFDTDGDGALSREEAEAAKDDLRAALEAKRDELLQRFDADGDGSLDANERDQVRAHAQTKLRVRRADTDRDGSLSQTELDAALRLIDSGAPEADYNGDGDVNARDYQTLVDTIPLS